MKSITKKDMYLWALKAAIVNLESEFTSVSNAKDEKKEFKPKYRIFFSDFFTCFFVMFIMLGKAFSRKKRYRFIIIE